MQCQPQSSRLTFWLSVAIIALETGFYDQSHFIRTFHRIYKVSPNAYRLRHRRPLD